MNCRLCRGGDVDLIHNSRGGSQRKVQDLAGAE
jgi:hypothetical protein